jgi:hypothetical protein
MVLDSYLSQRAGRLKRLFGPQIELFHDASLVKVMRLKDTDLCRLKGAAAVYLWHSLNAAFPDQSFDLGPDGLTRYQFFVERLPNRTPNGVLLPKSETFLSYNVLQSELVGVLSNLGILGGFSHFQVPCNVRIVVGKDNLGANQRAYSSSKIHTDLWNGEPHHSILFNVPLLGDPKSVSMAFFEPSSFPAEIACRLNDYNLGQTVVDSSHQCNCGFELGHVYVSDSFSLHQTVRAGDGIRLSLDFRALTREVLAGESANIDDSNAEYVAANKWLQAGKQLILTASDPLDSFHRRRRGEKVALRPVSMLAIKELI